MLHSLPVISVNGVIDGQISPLDRGFAYGDGVFETCRMLRSAIPLWSLHKDRLLQSASRLAIPLDIELVERHLANTLAAIEAGALRNAVIKIIVTRGEGGRGYRAPEVMVPTLVVGIFPAVIYPDYYFSAGVVARLCDQRLSCNPSLAGLKHLNRLEQVLARAEWQDESIAEGVLLNSNGDLIEAVFSNIFIVKNDVLYTPDLSESGVAGVMRRYLIEVVAKALQLNVQVKTLSFSDLLDADECFFCNSLYGVWPIQKLLHTQETDFYRGEITTRLQQYLSQQLNFSLGI